ncbi:hypothetical protein V6N13_115933 [Hibiscus sabdariffa]|uniref:DUF4378 domain-containing protein n=1 Tax=Hibiscus sabdariffa TaxID=183260 RepID=A0ABR2QSB1_9ROSI
MALISIPTDHIKLSLEKKPPLMLKDYLLRDDLSSCSSNGFKSFPRQRCCTTVRFLLETELKNSKDKYTTTTKRLLKRSRSKAGASATTISALQRASEAVLNAVKLLPFPSIKSSSPSLKRNCSRKPHFARSFSRKLFKRSFWRKADKENDGGENRRCKMFREFLEEKNQPSDENTSTNVVTTADTSSSTMSMTASRVSSNSNSNSRVRIEFTAEVLQSWSGNSESSSEADVVEGETSLPKTEKVSTVVGVAVGEESINFTKEHNWANEEGKEQFSPVSVLDCPFDDEEEDNNSHFEDGSPHVEGRKPKLMQKFRRFDSLGQLEPVDLEKRIAMTEHECPDDDTEGDEKLLKAKIPSKIFKFMDGTLLLDLFRETGLEDLKMVEDWVDGNCEDMFVGWEMEEGRKSYLKETERNDNWRNFNEENQDVGSAVEMEVFSSLVDELLTDFF